MIPANVQDEQRRLGFLRREVGAVRLVGALDHLAFAVISEQEDFGAEGEQEGILTQREGPAVRRKNVSPGFEREAYTGAKGRDGTYSRVASHVSKSLKSAAGPSESINVT